MAILWAFQTDGFIVQGDLFYSLSITWQYKGYRGLKGVTDGYRRLQGVTGVTRGLQGGYKGLQTVKEDWLFN